MIRGEDSGEPVSEAELENSSLVIENNHHSVQVGDVRFSGTHTLDDSASPHTIDTDDHEGPFVEQTALGIFKLEDDVFTVCFGAPGEARPTEFTTKSGTGVILHAWKRV